MELEMEQMRPCRAGCTFWPGRTEDQERPAHMATHNRHINCNESLQAASLCGVPRQRGCWLSRRQAAAGMLGEAAASDTACQPLRSRPYLLI